MDKTQRGGTRTQREKGLKWRLDLKNRERTGTRRAGTQWDQDPRGAGTQESRECKGTETQRKQGSVGTETQGYRN